MSARRTFLLSTTTKSKIQLIRGTISVIPGTISHLWWKHHNQMIFWRIWDAISTLVMIFHAQLINVGFVVTNKCLSMRWCSCNDALFMMLLQCSYFLSGILNTLAECSLLLKPHSNIQPKHNLCALPIFLCQVTIFAFIFAFMSWYCK